MVLNAVYKMFLRNCLKFFVHFILLLLLGFSILAGTNLMRIVSYKIEQLHKEPDCNVSQTHFLQGYFTLQDDAGIDKMNRNTLLYTFQRYVNNRQWKCCYVEKLWKNETENNVVCMDELNLTGLGCTVFIFSITSDDGSLRESFKHERDSWNGFFCYFCVFDYRPDTTHLKIPSYYCYHNWGLSAKSMDSRNLKSLPDIRQTLYYHGIIHYMKLNAGAWDWETLSAMVESGELAFVKQLCLEIDFDGNSHLSRYSQWHGKGSDSILLKKSLKTFRKLYKHGFLIVTVEPADFSITQTDVISLLFINSNIFGQNY